MRPSRVVAKLKRGEPVLITAVHLTDPSVCELASLMGFDCIWLNMEHHGYSLETGLTDDACGTRGRVRRDREAGKGEFMRMGRILEAAPKGSCIPAAPMPPKRPRWSAGPSSRRWGNAASMAPAPTRLTA